MNQIQSLAAVFVLGAFLPLVGCGPNRAVRDQSSSAGTQATSGTQAVLRVEGMT